MTIDAPTLDTITGHTVMVKMRELIKQMTTFAKEVADLVNTIPTEVQDTYSREAIDEMLDEIESAISTLSDSVYPKTEVYNKTESDELLDTKADTDSVYTKSETDELLSTKADTSDVYDKSETDDLLSAKANSSDVYTKNEVYNTQEVYNMQEVNNLLNDKQDELTAGTGITIQNNVISASISGANIIPLQVSNVNNPSSGPLMENVQVGDLVFVTFVANYNYYNAVFTYNNKVETMTIVSLENPGNYRKYFNVVLEGDGGAPQVYRRINHYIDTINVTDDSYTSTLQTITAITGFIIRSA